MKKFVFTAIAFALALVSCNREPVSNEPAPGVDVTIKGRVAETKTHIVGMEDAGGWIYTSEWDASGESLGVLFYQDAITASDSPTELPGELSNGEMTFHGTVPSLSDGTYKLFMFSPYSAYDSMGDGYLVGTLKPVQNPVAGSFDPACDVMGYAKNSVTVEQGSALIEDVVLERPFAILRINLNAASDDLAAGQKVTSVKMENSLLPLTGTFKITTDGTPGIVAPSNSVTASIASSEGITIGGSNNAVYVVVLPLPIPAGTPITFTVETEDYSGENAIVRTVTAPSGMTFEAGNVNVIDLKIRNKDVPVAARYAGGSGIEGDPWLIATPEHMVHMNEDLVNGETKYFKLIDDIDMTGIEWVPANTPSPYDKCIDFDGDNHTISNFTCTSDSYPSLFGVLYGKAYDFKMTNASVTAGAASACGIVGGYCGTSNIAAEARNIHVQGSVTCSYKVRGIGGMFGRVNGGVVKDCSAEVKVTNTGGDTGVGGMFGWASGTTIERCYANCVVSSNANYAGGLMGFDNGVVTIKDCYTAGSVSGSQRIGGIVGGLLKASSAVKNCYSTSTVTAQAVVGGIIAHASLDGWTAASSTPANVVEKCIAWNGFITATTAPSETYPNRGSSGVIVGYCSKSNYLTDCYRKAEIIFQDNWLGNVPFDQENASPTDPLVTDTEGKKYNYPYHGKAAAATATVSSVAQSLGWSADVWDFSGALPTLK